MRANTQSKSILSALIITTGLISFAQIQAQTKQQAPTQTIFIDNAKLVTGTEAGIFDETDILIENGQIQNIGKDLTAPADATIFEASGQWVTPGLFLPFSQIGLVDISAESRTNDTRAAKSKTSVSEMGADSFNPKASAISVTRIEGITHAAIAPSASHNIFGGIGFIANLTGEFDSIVQKNAFVYVQLGERGAELAGGSRSASLAQFRSALDDASAYPSRYKTPKDGDILSRKDASALAKAARGAMPIIISVDRASDILKIIEIKNEFGDLDIILLGAADAWRVASQIKQAGLKVMVDPHENLPSSFQAVAARSDNVLQLDTAGVDYAIMNYTQDLGHNGRLLPQHAGNAVGNGLAWEKAFAAITTTPARWFGLETATLETGADTLVIWDADPLEVTAAPKFIMIDGKVQNLESRQTALRDRYNPLNQDTRPHKYRSID